MSLGLLTRFGVTRAALVAAEFWRTPVINATSVADPAYYDPDTSTTSAQTVNLERGQVASPEAHAHCPAAVTAGWASRVEILTTDNPQTVINANPAGTLFVLKAGVHQDRRITLRAGDMLVGEDGAILDGSGLTASSAAEEHAIYSDATGPTIYNLIVRNYPWFDDGTQVPDGGTVRLDAGGLIYNLDVHDNGNIGIQTMGPDAIVRWCVARRNGRINYLPNNWGAASTRTGTRLEYCESDTGNVANFDQTNEAGGSKFVHCTNGVARFNYFHGDVGYGIWFDGMYNTGVTIEYNVTIGEERSGIHYEIASTGTIRYNTIEGCGGSGALFLSTSSDNLVYGNFLRWNVDGIWVYDENRDPARGTGNEVYENTIYQDNITTAWSTGNVGVMSSEHSIDPAVVNNVWHDNVYYVDDGASGANLATVTMFDWGNYDAQKTWSEWQALADETGTTYEYAAKEDYTPPARPGSLSLTPGASQIEVSWAVESGATVGIYRSLTLGYGFSLVHTSTAGDSAWTDTGLTDGTTYYYMLQAEDAAGNKSGWTATVNAESGAAASPQNLIPDSENFGVWITAQSSGSPAITADYATGPFGGSAAARFYQPTDVGDYQRFRSSANALTRASMTSGGTYYCSFYIKRTDGPGTISVGMRSASDVFATGDITAVVDIDAGTVTGATGGVIDAGAGWFRVWWTEAAVNTGSFGFFLGLNGYDLNQAHADCVIDCVQVNTGSLKDYAKTTGTALP